MGRNKNRITELILCVFLGWMGAHKFYKNETGIGILYLFTFGLFGLGWLSDIVKILRETNIVDDMFGQDSAAINRGDEYGIVLSGGKYVGGRDIPCGIYDVAVVFGYGAFQTDNPYVWVDFERERTYNRYSNLEIMNNTVLEVDLELSIRIFNKRELSGLYEHKIEENDKTEEAKPQPLELDCDSMDGWEFEEFCARILRRNGYSDVEVTKGSGDQGVDILAERDGIKYAVQCKHYSQSVGNKAIQEIFAGKQFYHCHVGIVMTSNYFTKSAKELAKENGIILWDKDYLKKFSGKNEIQEPVRDNDNCHVAPKIETTINTEPEEYIAEEKEEKNMYDEEKGIYPAGVYAVGDDIKIGKYLLSAKKGEGKDPMVACYEDYSKYRKEEINHIERFDDDYHLSLRENGMVIAVRDADIKRL